MPPPATPSTKDSLNSRLLAAIDERLGAPSAPAAPAAPLTMAEAIDARLTQEKQRETQQWNSLATAMAPRTIEPGAELPPAQAPPALPPPPPESFWESRTKGPQAVSGPLGPLKQAVGPPAPAPTARINPFADVPKGNLWESYVGEAPPTEAELGAEKKGALEERIASRQMSIGPREPRGKLFIGPRPTGATIGPREPTAVEGLKTAFKAGLKDTSVGKVKRLLDGEGAAPIPPDAPKAREEGQPLPHYIDANDKMWIVDHASDVMVPVDVYQEAQDLAKGGLVAKAIHGITSVAFDPATYLGGILGGTAAKVGIKYAGSAAARKLLATKFGQRAVAGGVALGTMSAAGEIQGQRLAKGPGKFDSREAIENTLNSAALGTVALGVGAIPKVGLAAEIAAFEVMGAAQQGRTPSLEGLAESAGVILGLKSTTAIRKALRAQRRPTRKQQERIAAAIEELARTAEKPAPEVTPEVGEVPGEKARPAPRGEVVPRVPVAPEAPGAAPVLPEIPPKPLVKEPADAEAVPVDTGRARETGRAVERREDEGRKDLQRDEGAQRPEAEREAPRPEGIPKEEAVKPKTFEEFEKEYKAAFAEMNKYAPDQAGSNIWAERMAKMADENPKWVEAIEEKAEKPAPPKPAPAVAPEVRLSAGETATTSSGRSTTPFPKIDTSTNQKAGNTIRRVNQWLIDNAVAEAEARGDEFNGRVFRGETVKNLPSASIESMNEYLFGEQPPVLPSVLKPMAPAPPKPVPTLPPKPPEPVKPTSVEEKLRAKPLRPPKRKALKLPPIPAAEQEKLAEREKKTPDYSARFVPVEEAKTAGATISDPVDMPKGLGLLKKFIKEVPEFKLDPTFVVTEDGRLKFQDGGKYVFNPTAIAIALPEGIKPGERVRLDLDAVKKAKVGQKVVLLVEKAAELPVKEVSAPSPLRELAAPERPIKPTAKGRIPVAEIPGGKVKSLRSIRLDLRKAPGIERLVRVAKGKRGALGTYYPGSARTEIRHEGDLEATAHEVAHSLDDLYGIVGAWAKNRLRSPYDSELIPAFSQHGSVAKTGPRSKLVYVRAEGVAEWIRAYMVNPEAAVKAAPKFTEFFLEKVPPKTVESINKFGRQIREFAGLDPMTRTMAGVEMEAPKRELRERLPEAKETFLRQFDDVLAPIFKDIADASKLRKAEGKKPPLPEADPGMAVRRYAGVQSIVDRVLNDGPIDENYKHVKGVGGLEWLFEPLDASSKKARDKDIYDTVSVMIAERVVERAKNLDIDAGKLKEVLATIRERKLAGKSVKAATEEFLRLKKRIGLEGSAAKVDSFVAQKKRRMVGIGGGIFDDTEQAKEALAQFNKRPEANQKRIKEAIRRYRAFSNALLKYARDKGRISAERYDAIMADNEYYVDLHRIMTDLDPHVVASVAGRGTLGSSSPIVHKFKGSTRTIKNPYTSLIEKAHLIIREVERNEAKRLYADQFESPRAMYRGGVVDYDSIASKATEKGDNTIKYFRDGKIKYLTVRPETHAAFDNWGEVDHPTAIDKWVMRMPAKIIHWGVTQFHGFMVRNVLRDPFHRALVGKSMPWSRLYFTGLTKEGREELKTLAEGYELYGGGQFGFYTTRAKHNRALKDAMHKAVKRKDTILSFPRDVLRFNTALGAQTEKIGRLVEYDTLFKHAKEELGYDDKNAGIYAAAGARALMDYAVRGSAVAWVNNYVPFTAASVRGVSTVAKAVKDRPKHVAGRWAATIGAMTIANYFWNWYYDDEDELAQQPAYLRDMFWNYKIMPDLWLRFPKPWEPGVLGSIITRGLDAARGRPHAFEGYGRSVISAISPVDIQGLMGPLHTYIGPLMNKDPFRNKYLVPPWEAEKDLDLREGTEFASRIGKILQEGMGIDARKIDYMIESQFGGVGRMAVKVSDVGRKDKDAGRRLAMEETGLLIGSPGYAARDVQWVMDFARRRGLTQIPEVDILRDKLKATRETTTRKERDVAKLKARSYATKLRELMPNIDRRERVIDDWEAKKEAGEPGLWDAIKAWNGKAKGDLTMKRIDRREVQESYRRKSRGERKRPDRYRLFKGGKTTREAATELLKP